MPAGEGEEGEAEGERAVEGGGESGELVLMAGAEEEESTSALRRGIVHVGSRNRPRSLVSMKQGKQLMRMGNNITQQRHCTKPLIFLPKLGRKEHT